MDNEKEYKVKQICDSMLYIKELEARHLSRLYYLIFWKGYPDKKITWKPALAI